MIGETIGRLLFVTIVGTACLAMTSCRPLEVPAGAQTPPAEPAAELVQVTAPERKSIVRQTTQPAAVHAYHQAQIYAKAAGYLKELKVDIGSRVAAGDTLATIDVPEMAKRRERQQSIGRRMQAERDRATAGVKVAEANVQSFTAGLDEAQAKVQQADAQLKADRVQYERIVRLVREQAAEQQQQDEAESRFEASQAAKSAAEAARTSAEAALVVARSRLAAAQADVAVAEAAADVAQSELAELDELIRYATLTAPFDGIVVGRNVDPGDLVRNAESAAGNGSPPLFVVAKVDRVRVRVAVPERDAPWTTIGDAATLTFQALPGKSFTGSVSRIAGGLDEQTRTMAVEIDLSNDQSQLLPGMFGQAVITLEDHPDSLILPAGVVRYDETGKSYVYVADESSTVQRIDVETGLDDGNQIEITAGLTGKERVIVPTARRLRAGQKVRSEK